MTSKIMPSVVQIKKESLQQLVTEVRETIAINIQPVENKKYGITDMWNSHRNARTTVSRRRYFPKAF